MPKSRKYLIIGYILAFGSTIGFYEQPRLIYMLIGFIGGIFVLLKTLALTGDKKQRQLYILYDILILAFVQIVSYSMENFIQYGRFVVVLIVFPYILFMAKKTYI